MGFIIHLLIFFVFLISHNRSNIHFILEKWEEHDRSVFDTFQDMNAPRNFKAFYERLPDNSVFFAVIQGSGGKYDPPILKELGAKNWDLNVRDSYAFIGGKTDEPRPWFNEVTEIQGEGPAIISGVLSAGKPPPKDKTGTENSEYTVILLLLKNHKWSMQLSWRSKNRKRTSSSKRYTFI